MSWLQRALLSDPAVVDYLRRELERNERNLCESAGVAADFNRATERLRARIGPATRTGRPAQGGSSR